MWLFHVATEKHNGYVILQMATKVFNG